jgi:hypothetical protein
MSFLGGFSAPFVSALQKRYQRAYFELTTAPTQSKKMGPINVRRKFIFFKKKSHRGIGNGRWSKPRRKREATI